MSSYLLPKKTRVIIALVIWSFVIFLLIFCIKAISESNTNEIDQNGKKINRVFKLYQNKIYAAVPSDGYMLIPEADVQTFRALVDDSYKDAHIGVDKNNVYVGNLIIPKLNPATTKALGNDYYSDGTSTYYCGSNTIKNPELNDWKENFQKIKHKMFNGKRPQVYLYPTVELPESNTPYHAILRFIATNGQKAFYKGKLMPDANPSKLRQLDNLEEDDDVRKSDVYYTDNYNVYFEYTKLPLKSNDKLYSFYIGTLTQEPYLYDPLNGSVFVKDIRFPQENEPYKLISRYSRHVNQVLFLSQNNIYYYDNQKTEVKKAGENPFLKSRFQEIAPLVFSDGAQVLYLEGSEVWGTSRYNNSLKSRSTHLYQLEGGKGNWEKLGNIYKGSVWKNDNQLYYFDELGSSQLFRHTIYKIADWATANQLLHKKNNPEEIRKLVKNEKLIKVKRTEILQAKTHY